MLMIIDLDCSQVEKGAVLQLEARTSVNQDLPPVDSDDEAAD